MSDEAVMVSRDTEAISASAAGLIAAGDGEDVAFSLQREIFRLVRGGMRDPHEIASRIMMALSPGDFASLFKALLVPEVRHCIGKLRLMARAKTTTIANDPRSTKSAKWNAVRESALNAIYRAPGGYKSLHEMTAPECRFAADSYLANAQFNADQAERLKKTAAAMEKRKAKVAGDLPRKTIVEIWK